MTASLVSPKTGYYAISDNALTVYNLLVSINTEGNSRYCKNGYVYIKQQQLADVVNLSRGYISRLIDELADVGLISKTRARPLKIKIEEVC